ncbi:MAG: hypothetical protein K2J25_06630, partial [Oscillospiraceae bacterium]|nr:hypothetical protein [Oscillospiraceae bacterium]
PKITAPDILIVAEKGCEALAVKKAVVLRESGLCVEHFLETDFDLAQDYARTRNIKKLILISSEQEQEVCIA